MRNRNGAQLYEVTDEELDLSQQALQYQLEASVRAQESEDEDWTVDEDTPDFSTNPWFVEMTLF